MTARTRGTLLDKYDIKRAHKALYAPSSADFALVEVPEMQYLAVDGHGDPNTAQAYADAIEALYGVSYTLKFESKNTLGRDFVVGPLEALWRADDMTAFTSRDKDSWGWTAMIVQPDWITADMVDAAIAKLKSKKSLPAIDELRLLTLDEGLSVQILHIGSYDDEAPTLDRLHHAYLPLNALDFNGDHHEVYLSDARRTEPAKLKTVLRQPVRRR